MAFSLLESSLKKSFARSAILGSGSSRHLAISPSWPFTLIIPLRIKWVSTMSVFFLTRRSLSERPLYSSLLFSSIILLKETATSPRAMTILLLMSGSLDVSRILNSRRWCWSQNCELTHRSLLNESVAAARNVRFCYNYCSVLNG